jgi:hypothetical protein
MSDIVFYDWYRGFWTNATIRRYTSVGWSLMGAAEKLGIATSNKLKEVHGNNEVKFPDIKINGIPIAKSKLP